MISYNPKTKKKYLVIISTLVTKLVKMCVPHCKNIFTDTQVFEN